MRYKKAILTALIGFLCVPTCMAQYSDTGKYNYVRPAGEKLTSDMKNCFSIGFGAGGYYPYFGTYYTESPNLILSYERTAFKHIASGNINLGAIASYKQINSNYVDYNNGFTYRQKWNYYVVGVKVVYHLTDFPSKLIEPYAGAMLGYYITGFKFSSDDPEYAEPGDPGQVLSNNIYPDFFAPGIFVGIRTRFSNHGSTWLEAGYGYTSIAFGLSYSI